jgi:CYTH domain-containing protein
MAEINQATAAALGWPKSKYAWVEHERRWLCRSVPLDRVVSAEVYEDLYVTGTQLRLREAKPAEGGPAMLRLGRKADVSPSVRLLTSIYLSPEEFRLLSALPGERLHKTRHSLGKIDGADVFVDVFEGALSGLIMAEAEFENVDAMVRYPMPDFAYEEVTEDVRYTGGRLVTDGLPEVGQGSGKTSASSP